MDKIVVYTAIFGDRDLLQTPQKFDGVSYVCFTDNPAIMSDVWEMRYTPPTKDHPRRQAKIYKICPHAYFPDHAYSIWVDATHIPAIHPVDMIQKFLERNDLALFAHNKRSCMYDEAKECIRQNLDDISIIKNQILKYKKNGYPENNGLATCTVIMRRHNQPRIIEAMGLWWKEIQEHSMRDQLSFNYVMHTLAVPYFTIEQDVYNNPLFKRHYHIGTPEFYLEKHVIQPMYNRINNRMRRNNSILRFFHKKTIQACALIDRNVGLVGVHLNTLSPKTYQYVKTKLLNR